MHVDHCDSRLCALAACLFFWYGGSWNAFAAYADLSDLRLFLPAVCLILFQGRLTAFLLPFQGFLRAF